MFWFDRNDERAVFMDNRVETHVLTRKGQKKKETLIIRPDVVGDFTKMPFKDESFALVIFDPPHLRYNGATGWQAKKYGRLDGTWKEVLRAGFAECFRVLRPAGTLIFKWSDVDITVQRVLALTPERPLFGNRSGKQAKTHWIVFTKASTTQTERAVCHE